MKNSSRARLSALVIAVVLTLAACATRPALTDHGFQFDALRDSPGIEILNYRYGTSDLPGTRVPPGALKGEIPQHTGTFGPMRVGVLYVKWRIKATGEVFEDSVDLGSRLSQDITGYRIRFVVKGAQLYVYLISPNRRPPNAPRPEVSFYQEFEVTRIYP
jgi:hypothetical protein